MAGRREKLRRVGIIPEYRGFTPDGLASGDAIDMTVDELEVLPHGTKNRKNGIFLFKTSLQFWRIVPIRNST